MAEAEAVYRYESGNIAHAPKKDCGPLDFYKRFVPLLSWLSCFCRCTLMPRARWAPCSDKHLSLQILQGSYARLSVVAAVCRDDHACLVHRCLW